MCLVDELVVIVTGDDKKVRNDIEKRGINTIYWRWRYFWDGGIRPTSDINRKGERES